MNIWEDLKYKLLTRKSAVNQLILINIVVFLAASLFQLMMYFFNLSGEANVILRYLYVPGDFGIFIYRIWTPLTYQFMHDGVRHIIINMLLFYYMATILNDFLGSKKVWFVYIIGGLFGAFLYLLSCNIFPVFAPVKSSFFLVGSSGSVMAIMAAAAALVPNYELFFFGIFRLKLKWLALALIAIDLVSIPKGNPGGGIAHLGGVMFGVLYIINLQGKINNPFIKFFNNLNQFIPKSVKPDEKKIYREKVYSNTEKNKANQRTPKRPSKPNQDEIDAILDKISNSGYDSLTKEEKEVLFRASE